MGAVAPLTPWDHTLIPGRLVSLVAALGTAVLIGWVLRREGFTLEVALAGMLVYLASKPVIDWTPFYRVDNLAVLFVVASYAVAGSFRRGWLPAAVLLAFGSLVKQTAVLAALPIAASLCMHRRFREAASFAAGTAGLVAAAWLALDWSTGGYASALGVRANLQKALDPAMGISFSYEFLCTPAAVAALASLASAYIARGAGVFGSLYAFAFLSETALATALVLKNGSAYNAFLVPSALAAICVCTFGLGPLAGLDRRRTAVVLCGLAVVLSYPGASSISRTSATARSWSVHRPRARCPRGGRGEKSWPTVTASARSSSSRAGLPARSTIRSSSGPSPRTGRRSGPGSSSRWRRVGSAASRWPSRSRCTTT